MEASDLAFAVLAVGERGFSSDALVRDALRWMGEGSVYETKKAPAFTLQLLPDVVAKTKEIVFKQKHV